MSALNGRGPAMRHPYPEFVNLEPLPGRTQDEFREWFERFIARREIPLSREEYQLAYAAGREAWRACWWFCAAARSAEERAEEGAETLSAHVVAVVDARAPDDPEKVGRGRR